MADSLEIQPLAGPLAATVRPPGSKSITNRALVCAALSTGESRLIGALDSDDTRVMIAALKQLGVEIQLNDDRRTLQVVGAAGRFPGGDVKLHVGNSGTTMRFLTAAVTLARGPVELDGVARMRQRPLGDLVDALSQLGADVRCLGANQCPPVRVAGGGLPGGEATIRGNVSSQFLSGLLMAAPYADRPVSIRLDGPLVSVPYVRMTLAVMQSFGARASCEQDYAAIEVPTDQAYVATDYAIEPDASAASYFLAAAAIVGGRVEVAGLTRDSLQGDVGFCDLLQQMGCRVEYLPDAIAVTGPAKLRGVDVDMNAVSDTAQTLAVAALFADRPTRIRNIAHVRHKETDRIAAVAAELVKLGAGVEEFDDGLLITPGALHAATIDTYDDHRMAMSFALAGLRIPGVRINDPGCTAKTYPGFFADFAALQT